jgi:hypothetical protein
MSKIIIAYLPVEEELESKDQSQILGGLSLYRTSNIGLQQPYYQVNASVFDQMKPQLLIGGGKIAYSTVMCPW